MTTDFQQTDTVANGSAIADLCSGNTSSSDTESNQAAVGGSAGSTERTHTPDNSAADLNGVWMELGGSDGGINEYDGAAGNWTTRLNITTGNHQLTLDEIHICRVNSSYVNQETLGSLTGIGANLSGTGVQSHTVNQASSTTITAGDKIIIIYAFDNAQSMANSFGYTPDQITVAPGDIPGLVQASFRVRTGDTVGLNVDSAWEEAVNVNATIDMEHIFRIRFEIGADGGFTGALKLQYNYAGAGYVDCEAPGVNPPTGVGVVPVSFAPSSQFDDADATTDVLSVESGTFVAGSGEESNNTASVTLVATEHTEFEFALVIRHLFGDDGTQWGFTSDAETVLFRLVLSDGTVLDTYDFTPTITINHPIGLIGGTFTETPGQVLVAEDTGVLYCIVEHGQLPTPIVPSMLKSDDGGDIWVPQDDADWASSTIELEAADLHYIPGDDKIYMGMTSSTDPDYREFQTSGHGTPDAFTAASFEVTAVTTVQEQVQAIIRRSDNTVVMFYQQETGGVGKLHYKIRSSGGTWGAEQDLEVSGSNNWNSCQAVIGASDLIHILYSDSAAGGTIYYQTLTSGDALGTRQALTTDTDSTNFSPFLKPIFWNDGGTEKIWLIYYKTTANNLFGRLVTAGSLGSESASAIIDNAVLSDRASSGRPTAAAVVDGTDVYVVYSHETDLDIYMTKSANGGTFDTDVEILDAVTCGLLSAVSFTHNGGNGGATVIGIIYDDERFGIGNTGGVVYFEHQIAAASVGQPTQIRTQGIPTGSGSRDRVGKWN